MVDIFVICVLLFVVVTAQCEAACPQSCECMPSGRGQQLQVVCRGGELESIFADLPENVVILSVEHVTTSRLVDLANLTRNQDVPISLTRISITGSSLNEIQGWAFKGMPSLHGLDLSQNNISIVDPEAFSGLGSLRTLNLSRNRIGDVETFLQPLVSLQQLDLSYNSIVDLRPNAFIGQTSLSHLRLDGNQLVTLGGLPLQTLTFLSKLSCRDCGLSWLKDDLFAAIPRVYHLDLGSNHFKRFPSSVIFSDMKHLKYLHLDNNYISSLLNSQFADLSLTFLGLSRNQITEVPERAFSGLSVEELDLSYNKLMKISDSLFFLGPQGLMNLNLAHNPIQELAPHAFQGLHSLETLNISSCSLSTLSSGLHELHNLRKLDISENNLKSVSDDDIAMFDRLVLVSLYKNNWTCDCQIKSLRDWLRGKRSIYKLHCLPSRHAKDCSELLCSSPTGLSDHRISLLDDSEIDGCSIQSAQTSAPLPSAAQAGIVVACLMASCGTLALTIYLWRRGRTRKKLVRVLSKRRSKKTNESRLDDEENEKISPFQDCDNESLRESHRSFVFRHYFETLVTDPKLLSRTSSSQPPSESQFQTDSVYSSNPSLYDRSHSFVVGIESTV